MTFSTKDTFSTKNAFLTKGLYKNHAAPRAEQVDLTALARTLGRMLRRLAVREEQPARPRRNSVACGA